MADIFYKGFTESEVADLENMLERIMTNLIGKEAKIS
jgi:hypothetical protein